MMPDPSDRNRNLVLSSVFIAMGVLLPVLFHMAGLGAFMLPLFWPVAASVFFLPVVWAAGIGIVTPLISMLITGMPPFPVLILIMLELPVLVFVTASVFYHSKAGSVLSLFAGLAVSRSFFLLMAALLAPLLGLPAQMVRVYYLVRSLPGILSILVFVPFLLYRMHGISVIRKESKLVENPS